MAKKDSEPTALFDHLFDQCFAVSAATWKDVLNHNQGIELIKCLAAGFRAQGSDLNSRLHLINLIAGRERIPGLLVLIHLAEYDNFLPIFLAGTDTGCNMALLDKQSFKIQSMVSLDQLFELIKNPRTDTLGNTYSFPQIAAIRGCAEDEIMTSGVIRKEGSPHEYAWLPEPFYQLLNQIVTTP